MGWKYLRSWLESLWYRLSSVFLFQKELSIAIVGLQNSGKTTFTSLLSGKSFESDTVPTIGIQINQFSLGNNLIKVYDLAGQTRFQCLWERCFDKVDLIIYMIDLSDVNYLEESFTKLTKIIQMTNDDRIPLIIAGNKTDLVPDPIETLATGNNHVDKDTNINIAPLTKYIPESVMQHYNFDDIQKLKLDNYNLHLLKKVDILSKQIGIDLKNHVLHIPLQPTDSNDCNSGLTSTTEKLPLDRDIALFTLSCKNGDFVQDILEWIIQL